MEPENNGRDNGGRFLPGNPGKPKGSSRNNLRGEVRRFLEDKWKEFPIWMDSLKDKEKVEVYISLLRFGLAPLQSINIQESDPDEPQSRSRIDYTKLSDSALHELLAATTVQDEES